MSMLVVLRRNASDSRDSPNRNSSVPLFTERSDRDSSPVSKKAWIVRRISEPPKSSQNRSSCSGPLEYDRDLGLNDFMDVIEPGRISLVCSVLLPLNSRRVVGLSHVLS